MRGRPPRPKSFSVATSPTPKWPAQIRLTITRAVRGFSGRVSQSASSRRPLPSTSEGRGSLPMTSRNRRGTVARLGRLAAFLDPHIPRRPLRHAVGQLVGPTADQGCEGSGDVGRRGRLARRRIDRADGPLTNRDVVDIQRRSRCPAPPVDQDRVDRAVPSGRERPIGEARHVSRRTERTGIGPPLEVEGEAQVVPRPRLDGPDRSGRAAVVGQDGLAQISIATAGGRAVPCPTTNR